MDGKLTRVESAVSATASGNLTWERWPHGSATALGLAGQRNPLGFAMVRYLGEQNSGAALEVVLVLATLLQREYERKRTVSVLTSPSPLPAGQYAEWKELAFQAFEFWNNPRCRQCHGRGVMGIEQKGCQSCGGTGELGIYDADYSIREAVGLLLEAQQWMEGQLGKLLKDLPHIAVSDGYAVNLPTVSGLRNCDFRSRADTGFHGHFDSE